MESQSKMFCYQCQETARCRILPAFFTPDILKVLQEKFNIGTISTVENDIATLIGKA